MPVSNSKRFLEEENYCRCKWRVAKEVLEEKFQGLPADFLNFICLNLAFPGNLLTIYQTMKLSYTHMCMSCIIANSWSEIFFLKKNVHGGRV